MKIFKNKSGFTLVELIIIIAVSAIVLTPFSFLMTASLQNEADVNRTIDAQHKTQSAFIVINEMTRGSGFSEIEKITNYFSHGEAIRIGTKVVLLKGTNLIYQTYDTSSENISSEVVLSEYVNNVLFTKTDDALDITLSIDKFNDGRIDVFNYKYSKRE